MNKESRFLSEMNHLLEDGVITLGEIADKLKGKGLVFLSLVCVLPFMQPIPIPGLSTVLGFVIILQGIGLAVSGKPLLTKKMREIELSPEKVATFVRGAKKIFPWIGWLVKVRGEEFLQHKILKILAGLSLVFLAAFLSLPLPLPSSNFLPAIGIFFICLGMLEDDFLLVTLGVSYAILFAWLLSITGNLLWSEMINSAWWGRYF
ncbi:MAG: exopolysaccharide biosynthesis protein [Bacteriovoracaceae bacterium]|nr:exopolysaccharide biosynthesis protein [Bacteriovoracaceae bacterium]